MPQFPSPVDGAQLFYRDYKPIEANCSTPEAGTKPALVFLHGWPYSSLMWEPITLSLCQSHNFRCIATDRRGFGKSDWDGHRRGDITYITFAEDTAFLLKTVLELGPFVIITFGMGAGESVLAFEENEHFRTNCKGLVWLTPTLPGLIPGTDTRTTGPPETWAPILAGIESSRADYVHASLPGVLVGKTEFSLSPETLRHYERIVEDADGLAIQRCARIVFSAGFVEILRQMGQHCTAPILCIHGGADTSTPYEVSTKVVKEIMPGVEVKVYEDAPHALCITHRTKVIEDILEFIDTGMH